MTGRSPEADDPRQAFDALRAHVHVLHEEIPLLHFLGLRLRQSADPDVVIVEMPNTETTRNRMGTPHGGAIAALADHAGGLTAAVLTGRGGPTVDLHIRFLAPAGDETVIAEGRLLRDGGRLAVTEVRMYDGSGRLLAVASVSTAPGKVPAGPPD